jgi:Arc/MetJ-type ribon-helix-helix transcriptional regulator
MAKKTVIQNVRLDAQQVAQIDRLVAKWSSASGLEATRADVIRKAIDALLQAERRA